MLKLRSELPIRVAVVAADGVRVDDDPRAFDELSACAARYRERYAARGITAARRDTR